jgi:hypothetical protein
LFPRRLGLLEHLVLLWHLGLLRHGVQGNERNDVTRGGDYRERAAGFKCKQC